MFKDSNQYTIYYRFLFRIANKKFRVPQKVFAFALDMMTIQNFLKFFFQKIILITLVYLMIMDVMMKTHLSIKSSKTEIT